MSWLKKNWKTTLWVLGALLPFVLAFLLKRHKDKNEMRKAFGDTMKKGHEIKVAYLQGRKEEILKTLPENHAKVVEVDKQLKVVEKKREEAKLTAEGMNSEDIARELAKLGYK